MRDNNQRYERGHGERPQYEGPHEWHGHEGRGGGRGRGAHGRGEGHERLERGMLRYVILDVLRDEAKHGYEIIKQVEQQTRGGYAPSPGTLYPTLQYLEDLGFVSASQGESRKVYTITAAGKAELEQHAEVASGFWSRYSEQTGSDTNQYEVSFLRYALDDLSRTVWSSLSMAIAADDKATIRVVRQAIEGCQNQVRDIVAQAVEARSVTNKPQQDEQ